MENKLPLYRIFPCVEALILDQANIIGNMPFTHITMSKRINHSSVNTLHIICKLINLDFIEKLPCAKEKTQLYKFSIEKFPKLMFFAMDFHIKFLEEQINQ